METILIATGNQWKSKGIKEQLFGLPFEFVDLQNVGLDNEVEEDGATYKENAHKKAKTFHNETGYPTIADDTGMEVAALPGELGVRTKRWGAGPDVDFNTWAQYFFERMEGVLDRRVIFHCAVAFVSDSVDRVVQSSTSGIVLEPKKFPPPAGANMMSALFLPDKSLKTYHHLTAPERLRIKHREKAYSRLRSYLENNYETSRHTRSTH